MRLAHTPDSPHKGPARRAGEDSEFEELLRRALELQARGEELDQDELAGGDASLARRLTEALTRARNLPGLFATSLGNEVHKGRVLASRYQLEERLGAGAMGVVYRARDLELGRAVAIKVLRAGPGDHDQAQERFEREAEILASVRHPGVVTLHDRGRMPDGEAFLVMELLEGISLSEVIEEAHDPEGEGNREETAWIARRLGLSGLAESSFVRACVRWVAELAQGLTAVHEAQGFHRDIKPSNVFLRSDGQPLLIDFGIARRAGDALITHEDSTVGTPAYLSPEALRPKHGPEVAQDVYSLTATLYHLVTGRPPYEGTPPQVLAALATREPVRAGRLCPGLSRDLQAILEKGMDRDPARRYSTAQALESDLRALLEHRAVQARPSNGAQRLWRRARRSRFVQGAALVLVLGGLAAFGWNLDANRSARRAASFEEAWSHVLLNRTISEYPANRVSAIGSENEQFLELLDTAVRHASSPLPARLVRAAARLDLGDSAGATEDMRAVAAAAGPFARELATRYSALGADAVGVGALSLDDLPPPDSRADVYVASYHALRELRFPEAFELLERPVLDGYRPAEELRLLLAPFTRGFARKGVPDGKVARMAADWHEDIVRFEEGLPRKTALTACLLGTALDFQKRWDAALAPLDEAIELAPYAIAPRLNAARAAFRAGHYDIVPGYLEPAIASLPQYWRPYDHLIRALLESEDFEGAERALSKAPFANSGSQAALKLELEADLASLRAWAAHNDGDLEAARQGARYAIERYDLLVKETGFEETPRSLIARALADGDPNRIFDAMLRGLEVNPLDERRIAAMLEFAPESLDARNRDALLDYLGSLRTHLLQFLRVPELPAAVSTAARNP